MVAGSLGTKVATKTSYSPLVRGRDVRTDLVVEEEKESFAPLSRSEVVATIVAPPPPSPSPIPEPPSTPISGPTPPATFSPLVRGRDTRIFASETPSKFVSPASAGYTVEEAYSPEFAGSERATYEHTLQLLEETKGGGMVLRTAVVDKLEAEGIDRGKAWDIVRRAQLYGRRPEKYEKKFDSKIGDPIKPYQSEKILKAIRDRHAALLVTRGELGSEMDKIYRSGANIALATWEKGDPYGQKMSAGGAWFNISQENKLRYRDLQNQIKLLNTQIGAIGSQFETSGRQSIGNIKLKEPKTTLTAGALGKLEKFTDPFLYRSIRTPVPIEPVRGDPSPYTGIDTDTMARSPGGGGYISGPSCIGDVCPPVGGIMSPQFMGPGLSGPRTFRGGKRELKAGGYFTAPKVKTLQDLSLVEKAAVGYMTAVSNLPWVKPITTPTGSQKFQDWLKEAMTMGSAVTGTWNTKDIDKEFDTHFTTVPTGADLVQAKADYKVEVIKQWETDKQEAMTSSNKKDWLNLRSQDYDIAARSAARSGATLETTKEAYLASVSADYDADIKSQFSVANRDEWVGGVVKDYETDITKPPVLVPGVAPTITLVDKKGDVVFEGTKEEYRKHRLDQEPTLGQTGTSFGTSLIPVYGTYKYWQSARQGGWTPSEIGWMIASVGADVAMIVPPIGMAARAAIPVRAGFAGSRAAVVGRTFTSVGRMALKVPKLVRPSFRGVVGGVKTVAVEYSRSLAYPFRHPIATGRAIKGLSTGTMTFPMSGLGVPKIKPSKKYDPTKVIYGDSGQSPLQVGAGDPQWATVKYVDLPEGPPLGYVPEGPRPIGQIVRKVHPGTQGYRLSSSGVREWTPGIATGGASEVQIVPTKSWVQKNPNWTIKSSKPMRLGFGWEEPGTPRYLPTKGEMSVIEATGDVIPAGVKPADFWESLFGQHGWTGPYNIKKGLWGGVVRPEASFGGGGGSWGGRTPVSIAPPPVGSGVSIAPATTATMTPEQLARIGGAGSVSPTPVIGAPIPVMPAPIVPPIGPITPFIPIPRRTKQPLFPEVIPSTTSPSTTPAPHIVAEPAFNAPSLKFSAPTVEPSYLPFGAPSPMISPLSITAPVSMPTPIPAFIPAPIPTPTIPTPVPIVPTPELPKPKIPIIPPIPGLPSLGGGGIAGLGSAWKLGSTGIWKFRGHPVFAPHPMSGKLTGGYFGKIKIKYGSIASKAYREEVEKAKKAGKRKISRTIKDSRIDGGTIGSAGRFYIPTKAGV